MCKIPNCLNVIILNDIIFKLDELHYNLSFKKFDFTMLYIINYIIPHLCFIYF